jgi:Concanavalin A-like lectin/glucanases superfamily
MTDAPDAYRSAVSASFPRCYLPLNNLTDLVPGRPPATATGAVAFGVEDPWGRAAAARFSGNSGTNVWSHVDLPAPVLLATYPLTIESWFRNRGAAVGDATLVQVAAGAAQLLWRPDYANGGPLYYGSDLFAPPFSEALGGLWHHLAVTIDTAGAGAVYLDGVRVRVASAIAALPMVNPFAVIGARAGGAWGSSADVCHVALYDRALPAPEIAAHYAAGTPDTGSSACVRRAWLSLPGGRTMPLDGRGYFLTSLDLGAPTVRDVTQNRPDQHGIDDRTMYMGGRVVSVVVTALATAGARIDEVASAFGPYMVPDVRPVLHYVLDRADNPERTLTLRASAYSWPVVGPTQRDVSLQWVAADPVARSATVQSATAWSGSSTAAGRSYSLAYNRSYPAGGGAPVAGRIQSAGDVAVRPVVTLYGPLSHGVVTLTQDGATIGVLPMAAPARIDAGRWWTIDTAAHTATDDAGASVLASLDWSALAWPVVGAGTPATMALAGDGTTHVTQAVATWQDGYLW